MVNIGFPKFGDSKPRVWVGGEVSETTDAPALHREHVRDSSLPVQFMTLVEDFTPIKPVRGELNSFEDGMFRVGLFGLSQRQIFLLITVGLMFALLQITVG